MKKYNKLLVIIVIPAIIVAIGLFIIYSRYLPLNNSVFNDSELSRTSLVLIIPSDGSKNISTHNKLIIQELLNYFKNIEAKRVSKSTFYDRKNSEGYIINICDDTGLLYQIDLNDTYMRIVDTTKNKEPKYYFKFKNNINFDDIKKMIKE